MTPRGPKPPPLSTIQDAVRPPGEGPCGLPDLQQMAMDAVMAQEALGATFGEALACVASSLGMEVGKAVLDAFMDQGPEGDAVLNVLDEVARSAPDMANAWLGDVLVNQRMRPWEEDNVFHGIHLDGYPWITSLPAGVRVAGDLGLGQCGGLKTLSGPLWVEGRLSLFGCKALTRMGAPDSQVVVAGDLDLNGCENLKSLPGRLKVGQDCSFGACKALKVMPCDLSVGGTLRFYRCMAMQSLPAHLKVRGGLYVQQCPTWDGQIPPDADIGGFIYTDGHQEGIRLTEWRRLHGPQGA